MNHRNVLATGGPGAQGMSPNERSGGAGRLLGARPAEAYFVHCGRTTMIQQDIGEGRLICVIGVAPFRPAEFLIIQVKQKTAARWRVQ